MFSRVEITRFMLNNSRQIYEHFSFCARVYVGNLLERKIILIGYQRNRYNAPVHEFRDCENNVLSIDKYRCILKKIPFYPDDHIC
jgi:hypothetical protein